MADALFHTEQPQAAHPLRIEPAAVVLHGQQNLAVLAEHGNLHGAGLRMTANYLRASWTTR